MIKFFIYIDRLLFDFFNQTIANPVFDLIMPFITDLNKYTASFIVVGIVWIGLVILGGKTGRLAAVGLILVVALADQLNSSVLKAIFERPRPCHFVNGLQNIENVRLLVPCGGGRSFPSSHAANNAAVATFLSFYYPKLKWYFIIIALTIAFSRIYIGVHFPADVLAGLAVGIICGLVVLGALALSEKFISLIFKKQGTEDKE